MLLILYYFYQRYFFQKAVVVRTMECLGPFIGFCEEGVIFKKGIRPI